MKRSSTIATLSIGIVLTTAIIVVVVFASSSSSSYSFYSHNNGISKLSFAHPNLSNKKHQHHPNKGKRTSTDLPKKGGRTHVEDIRTILLSSTNEKNEGKSNPLAWLGSMLLQGAGFTTTTTTINTDKQNSLGLEDSCEAEENDPLLSSSPQNDKTKATGSVIRTAFRSKQMDGGSKPSSPQYTTRKDSQSSIAISMNGVTGDYNHYRTTALSNTPNRALSILTSDVMNALQAEWKGVLQNGDLGENLLIDGMSYHDFQVGRRYQFTSSSQNGRGGGGEQGGGRGVTIEITEPIEPCANLCKLPYINDASLEPMQRIQKCQMFLQRLGRRDGIRGWYAKVIEEGTIRLGDSISSLALG